MSSFLPSSSLRAAEALAGRFLQAALREAFRGARCERVNLVVSDTNPDARRLYEASGFEHLFSGVGMRWVAQGVVAAGDAPKA